MKKNIKKSCHNCEDYIVCYGFDEIETDKGENCPDWHLSFMVFQNMLEEQANQEQQQLT